MKTYNERREEHQSPESQTPKTMRFWFGVFMVMFYVGIGLLFIIFEPPMIFNKAVSCVVGGLLMLYGVFRGYRLYIGSN